MIPEWRGESVAILASGPSLTIEQVESVGDADCRTIVINNTFKLAPWADVLYACDYKWWQRYYNEVEQTFAGALWTQDEMAEREFGINRIESRALPGLSKTPGVIHQGGNSGYQAIGFAQQTGAARILLFGFDMHDKAGSHWHGDHEPVVRVNLDFAAWIPRFEELSADLKEQGVEVFNCTPGSALHCFAKG